MRPRPFHGITGALVIAFWLQCPAFLSAQSQAPDPPGREDRFRFGITLGGTGFVGVVGEWLWGDWSAELQIGTISFSDLSIAAAGKRYFANGKIRPAIGLGAWSLSVWSIEGNGSAFLLRAPLAVDWTVTSQHALGVEVGLNRAVWIRRIDPEDDTPPRANIVPFPGFYYRYSTEN